MWFWIALMVFFLIVFLVTKAVIRSQGGIVHAGLQQGYDVSLQPGWSGAADDGGELGDTTGDWSGGAGYDGGWSVGDGGGWGE